MTRKLLITYTDELCPTLHASSRSVVIGRQGQSKQTDSNCPEMYFIAVGGGGGDHQTLLYTKGHFPQVKLFGRLSATKRLTFAPFSQLGLIVGFDPPTCKYSFGISTIVSSVVL